MRETLDDVENALIDASNLLLELANEIENRDLHRFASLDKAIDDALRLVQAWKDEDIPHD